MTKKLLLSAPLIWGYSAFLGFIYSNFILGGFCPLIWFDISSFSFFQLLNQLSALISLFSSSQLNVLMCWSNDLLYFSCVIDSVDIFCALRLHDKLFSFFFFFFWSISAASFLTACVFFWNFQGHVVPVQPSLCSACSYHSSFLRRSY